MPTFLCIYHANCADGFAAAWVVRRQFGADVEFHRGVYSEAPPDVRGRDVFLVDFSYKRDVLLQMLRDCASMTIIDHHKTAAAEIEALAEMTQDEPDTWDRLVVIFDIERSGAGLTWDYFNKGVPRPPLINHIEDRDLWRFKLPGTREIQACIFSYPYVFEDWDVLVARSDTGDGLQSMVEQGMAIERKHFKDIAELLAVGQRRDVIAGHEVPVCNLPYTLSSDAGHAMGKGEKFAACYMDTPAGRVFSLRSAPDGIDVSEIAKLFGGGGHKHAAGFTVPMGTDVSRAGLQASAPAAAPTF